MKKTKKIISLLLTIQMLLACALIPSTIIQLVCIFP